MKAALGVAAYGGNYKRRRQKTGPEYFTADLSVIVVFSSPPHYTDCRAHVRAAKSSKQKKLLSLLIWERESVYVCN